MTIRSLTLSLVFSLSAACGGADTPAESTTTPAAETPAPAAAQTPAPEASDPRSPSSPVVTVQNLSKGTSGPSSKPVALKATSGLNQITVHVDNFTHYCSPEPSFVASVTGEELTIDLTKPASAVSRCVSPYSFDLVVALPGRNNVRSVVVRSDAGKELGKATVTSGE
jgi:hypothetical protein